MAGPIIYVDRSKIADGQLAELKRRIYELATFVEENEPRVLAYEVYFDEAANLMTVIHVHPDSASLASHFAIAGSAFGHFGDLLRMRSIDVYGRPDDEVIRLIRAKAADLGGGSVTVHEHHSGFLQVPPSHQAEGTEYG